jgi:hypothetical protein
VKCKAAELDQSGAVVMRIAAGQPPIEDETCWISSFNQKDADGRPASNKLLDFFGVLITAMIRRRFVPPSAPVHVTARIYFKMKMTSLKLYGCCVR